MRIKLTISAMLLAATMPGLAQAGCLQSPIPGATITSNFGFRLQPVYKTWRPHNGSDLRAAINTPIKSSHAGQVTYSGWMGSAGNAVIVLGADGVQTRYFHMNKAGIREGAMVQPGQTIGLSGKTGHSTTQPHLHFETRLNGGKQPVDPRTMFCQALPEKPGAGPDKAGNGSTVASGSTSGGTPSGSGGQSSGGNSPFNSEPDFNGYSTMSEHDMMKAEVERRFMNPDWHQVVGGCGGDQQQFMIDGKEYTSSDCNAFFNKELLMLVTLRNYLRYKIHDSMTSVEMMQATRSLDKMKRDQKEMRTLRQRAIATQK